MRRSWLVKSEPGTFSFDDLMASPERQTPWDGVRNYQARNFMRDDMRVGDAVLFYHSGTNPPGVVGLAEVASEPYPDPTQFDPASRYFDAESTREEPRWHLVEVRGCRPLARVISLAEIKRHPELRTMEVARRGSRLSVMPVEPRHVELILALADEEPSD